MNSTTYPVSFKLYANGHVGAFFADVPEAITAGSTEAEAAENARDALVVALSGYLDNGRQIPKPRKAKRGQAVVVLPSRASLKLAIHQAMLEEGVTQAHLLHYLAKTSAITT